jgi:hypothetical protein
VGNIVRARFLSIRRACKKSKRTMLLSVDRHKYFLHIMGGNFLSSFIIWLLRL